MVAIVLLSWGCDRAPAPHRSEGGLVVDPGTREVPGGNDSTTHVPDAEPELIVPEAWWPAGWLRVRVDHVDATTPFARIEGATVLAAGSTTATDNWGLAELIGIDAGTQTVEARAPGFATLYASVFQTSTHPVSVWLSAEETELWIFEGATGGTTVAGGATIDVPPLAFEDAHGEVLTGEIHASVLGLTASAQAAVLPSLENDDGAALLGLAGGWIAFDANGTALRVARPITLTLAMVPSSGVSFDAGELVPSWFFDAAAGHWVLGPDAVAGTDTFELSVDRSGWWIVAPLATSEVCYTGRVVSWDDIIASRAHVRVKSPEGLVHRAYQTQLDGTFCACGPATVPLWLTTWTLRPPSDELSSVAWHLEGSDQVTCDGAPSIGDVSAKVAPLTCVSGTLDPPVLGCSVSYVSASDYSEPLIVGEVAVSDESDPTFCLTLPAHNYLSLPSDFVYLGDRSVTCAMGACEQIGTLDCD